MSKIPVLVWLPAVFVLGGLVGYYGPAEELRTREERAAEEKAKPRANNAFGSFAQLVNIPAEARRPHRREQPKEERAASEAAPAPGEAAAAETPKEERPGRRRRERLAPQDLRARIDEAADLWRARIEIARGAAIEKLGLDEKGTASFDEAISAMNEKLRESMQLVADEIASAKSMTPELGVRLMGDLSASLAETYDAIGACVGEEMREEVSGLEIFNFIDPSVAEPLIAVQDKIEANGPGGWR